MTQYMERTRFHKRNPPKVPQKSNFIVILNAWTGNANCSLWTRNAMYKDFTTTTSQMWKHQTQYIMGIVDWCNRFLQSPIIMINWNECAGWHSQYLPYLVKLQCSFECPLRLWTWSLKSWFFCLLSLANMQTKKLLWRKMIKVLARPTNNAEQVCGQRKEILSANTSQNFALVCIRFLPSTGSISHLLSFASMLWNSFYFDKIIKYVIYVKVWQEARLQAFVKMQMNGNPEL